MIKEKFIYTQASSYLQLSLTLMRTLSAYLSFCLTISMSACPLVCQSIRLSVCLSLCIVSFAFIHVSDNQKTIIHTSISCSFIPSDVMVAFLLQLGAGMFRQVLLQVDSMAPIK